MTEIPEHLLKRSRDRKSAGGDASSSEASASTPATTTAAPVAKVVAETPVKAAVSKPEPAYIKAAKSRGRIPSWAMATLALLPIFLFMYVRGLQPQKAEASGPIAIGIENYGACASCHGADGGGGAGRVLKDGESLKTFPHIEDMLNWVYAGTEAYEAAGVATYGDPNREGGAHAPVHITAVPCPLKALWLVERSLITKFSDSSAIFVMTFQVLMKPVSGLKSTKSGAAPKAKSSWVSKTDP